MNQDAELIAAALDRRFGRIIIPACPEVCGRTARTIAAPRVRSRRLAYGAILIVVLIIAGAAPQASEALKLGYARLMAPFFVSSTPLAPGIHRADRLTIEEAQRRLPFSIVVPTGLPSHTRFLYAHVISEKPVPRVALTYEAHLAKRYYRIGITESPVPAGPARERFKLLIDGRAEVWTLSILRWKHGAVVMDLFAWGLPRDLSDRIVRANTR